MRRLLLSLCALLVGTACRDPRLDPVFPRGYRVDTYGQVAAQKIDVLWVVDNSGSMKPHQDNLARNFQSFIDEFTRSSVDYRLAITTTDIANDQGRFRGPVLSPQTNGVAQAFSQQIRVGTGGGSFEAGLDAARMSLQARLAANQPQYDAIVTCQEACPQGQGKEAFQCRDNCVTGSGIDFLRPDAYLDLVFITDEEDRSAYDVHTYYRSFKTAKGVGNDGTVTTAAIIGDVPTPACAQANSGTRYKQLSDMTGGEVGSICDAEFADSLKRLASNAVGLRRKFALEMSPNPKTIEVRVRYRCDAPAHMTARCTEVDRDECQASNATSETFGTVCKPQEGEPDGWVYEPEARVIFFAGDSVPNVPSQVELRYFEEGIEP